MRGPRTLLSVTLTTALAVGEVAFGPAAVLGQVNSERGSVDIEPLGRMIWDAVLEQGDPEMRFGQVAVGPDDAIAVVGSQREPGQFDPYSTLAGHVFHTLEGEIIQQARLSGSEGIQMTGIAFGPDGALYAVGTTSPLDPSGHLWRSHAGSEEWEKVAKIKGARFVDVEVVDGSVRIFGQLAKKPLQEDLRPMMWTVQPDDELKARRLSSKRQQAQIAAVSPGGGLVVFGSDPTAILRDAKHSSVAWTSDDGGKTWRKAKTPIKNRDQVISGLASTPAGIFASRIEFDEDGRASTMKVFSSDDGRTWTESVELDHIGPIEPFGDGVAVFGPGGRIHVTNDGNEWGQVDVPALEGFSVSGAVRDSDGNLYLSGVRVGEGGGTPALVKGEITDTSATSDAAASTRLRLRIVPVTPVEGDVQIGAAPDLDDVVSVEVHDDAGARRLEAEGYELTGGDDVYRYYILRDPETGASVELFQDCDAAGGPVAVVRNAIGPLRIAPHEGTDFAGPLDLAKAPGDRSAEPSIEFLPFDLCETLERDGSGLPSAEGSLPARASLPMGLEITVGEGAPVILSLTTDLRDAPDAGERPSSVGFKTFTASDGSQVSVVTRAESRSPEDDGSTDASVSMSVQHVDPDRVEVAEDTAPTRTNPYPEYVADLRGQDIHLEDRRSDIGEDAAAFQTAVYVLFPLIDLP